MHHYKYAKNSQKLSLAIIEIKHILMQSIDKNLAYRYHI